ncbi:putative outer membrane protein [Pedobacter sp. BAL39]|uniref:SusC/RagA family TonB-linked outer membrane protein n=1 Tax=Pedobacter sp. BAL39 TaxID=391596 RepID=UPI0001559A89|nr:SusC/RagA family TonB-linked outer membrane protein [Pedobacter sp. BAL39]EDM38052.1 putative outer membrane protein [Pedobacter sp. BAL39]
MRNFTLQKCPLFLRRGIIPLFLLTGSGVAITQASAAVELRSLKKAIDITGKVTDKNGQALPGVSIRVKGSTGGATTDTNGKFSLNVPDGKAVLVISYIGYRTQEVPINGKVTFDIQLDEENNDLTEVVVTALGISREKKSLGYSAQEIKGDDLDRAREANFSSGLAGKIAGVTVMNSPSGVGGSARVTIRGDKSLNINNNQPLYVIDGIPISNDSYGSSGSNYQEVDYGNGASLINPDDVESVNVLKGANAAALYGSRAANGVILITTKSGKRSKGVGISVNSGFTLESPLVLPDFQKKYGQGNDGEFSFVDGLGSGVRDGVDESWGPAFNGQLIPQFDSPTANGYRGGDIYLINDGTLGSAANLAARGAITATPWTNKFDLNDFYETGVTLNNNIALTGGNDKGSFRVSYTNLYQKGIVPNTDLKRNTFAFNSEYNLTPKLNVKASVNYILNESGNRPNISYGTENIIYLLNNWMGQQVDLNSLKDYWVKGMEGRQQFNFNYNYHDNPYFNLYENTNAQNAHRLIGNVALKYDVTNWLNVMMRAGTDYGNELRERKRAFSTQRYPRGAYREERVENTETNLDFLINATPKINEDFSLSLNAGGNMRINNNDQISTFTTELLTPGLYNLNNSAIPLVTEVFNPRKRVHSLYGAAQLSFRDYLYMDITARNDWSSALTLPVNYATLGITDNSYFYPSVSLSALISQMVKLPKWISYGKARLSVAKGGNDTDPYAFTQAYNKQNPIGSNPVFNTSGVLRNYNIKPEISTSIEGGLEWKFLDNRLGFDVSYYHMNTKNQILNNVPVSITSGWNTQILNAGEIQNSGIELAVNTTPVRSQFRWDFDINFSKNNSKVISLTDDINVYQMASKEAISIEARVGNRMGDMYGEVYKRVEDTNSPYYGQIINNETGRPLSTGTRERLGNYNPDWLAGLRNTFAYKGVNLSFLFDVRHGGKVFSLTQVVGREAGQLEETLLGRENGYDLSLPGNGVISPGVIQNADGTYRPNDVKLTARAWNSAFTNGRSIAEPVTYNASFIKLRELSLGYGIPSSFLQKYRITNMSISLVGRNLWVHSKVPHIDPEQVAMSGGTFVPGVESSSIPTTKSLGLNLKFNF